MNACFPRGKNYPLDTDIVLQKTKMNSLSYVKIPATSGTTATLSIFVPFVAGNKTVERKFENKKILFTGGLNEQTTGNQLSLANTPPRRRISIFPGGQEGGEMNDYRRNRKMSSREL